MSNADIEALIYLSMIAAAVVGAPLFGLYVAWADARETRRINADAAIWARLERVTRRHRPKPATIPAR